MTSRLRQTWLQWWTFSFWSGAILAAAVSLATLVLFVLVDALFRLPQRALVSPVRGLGGLSLAASPRSWSASNEVGGAWRPPRGGLSWRFRSWKAI